MVKRRPGVEIEVGMGVAGEAIDAAVATTSIRIDRPVEGEHCRLRHSIERRLRQHLKVMPANSGVRTERTRLFSRSNPGNAVGSRAASLEPLDQPSAPTIQTQFRLPSRLFDRLNRLRASYSDSALSAADATIE